MQALHLLLPLGHFLEVIIGGLLALYVIFLVEDEHHHFFGLDFVHLELSKDEGWPPVQFAGFVSSLVESGTDPGELDAIRDRIRALGLKPYDAFSPELDAYIASNASKLSYKNKVY